MFLNELVELIVETSMLKREKTIGMKTKRIHSTDLFSKPVHFLRVLELPKDFFLGLVLTLLN